MLFLSLDISRSDNVWEFHIMHWLLVGRTE